MGRTRQVKVGFVPPFDALTAPLAARRAMVEAMAAHDIDHIGLVDHVSFRGGQGYDGLVHAASVLSLVDRLPAYLGLYLLPLRHPLPVARQLATIAEIAPGRLTFAVGVGGDDRDEVANCGVDPGTRGARMDECLTVLRALLTGQPVTFDGDHLTLRDALVLPAPDPPIPIVVGGRSDAAHRRAARLGDGWLGLWASAARYAAIVEAIGAEAATIGRPDVDWQHGLTVWVGLGRSASEGRAHLAPAMGATYQQPFDRFERWSPCGPPDEIAAFLAPYVDAGCTTFNLMPRAASLAEVIEGVAEIRRLLVS
jgi:alkanesulfonate monooxygenase SsuD/methylene tetrahydromethanopterin reductase-like flavin-dependent oxidoreductase (luciferase family)